MGTLNTLKELRTATWAKGNDLLNRATAENRDLTAEESARFDALMKDVDGIDARLDDMRERTDRRNAADRAFAEIEGRSTVRWRAGDNDTQDAFRSMLLENNPRPITVRDDNPRSHYQPGVEARAVTKASPANYGATSFHSQIIESMMDGAAVMDAGATVIMTTSGETLRIPRATALSTAALVAEAATITESDPTLGAVDLGAYKYGVIVRCSREAIDDTAVDLLTYIAKETGMALGVSLGAHLMTGTGSGQPTGALTSATLGVNGPTGTATSFGSQATAGQGTDLLNSLYSAIAEPYTRSPACAFLARNATIGAIRNLKANTGELVGASWLNNPLAPFIPDSGVPAMAASAKSVVFGDWSRYFIRIVNGIRFERSDDVYFTSDQVAFRAIIRADGALIDPAALKYFQHSAT